MEQINQIENPLVLNQLLQAAKNVTSLEEFMTFIVSNTPEQQTIASPIITSYSLVASELNPQNKIKVSSNIYEDIQLIAQESSTNEDNSNGGNLESESAAKAAESEALMELGAFLSQLGEF